ncbi:hypothetical protein Trydic_g22416 [Trypoxylus dichotomus]
MIHLHLKGKSAEYSIRDSETEIWKPATLFWYKRKGSEELLCKLGFITYKAKEKPLLTRMQKSTELGRGLNGTQLYGVMKLGLKIALVVVEVSHKNQRRGLLD